MGGLKCDVSIVCSIVVGKKGNDNSIHCNHKGVLIYMKFILCQFILLVRNDYALVLSLLGYHDEPIYD